MVRKTKKNSKLNKKSKRLNKVGGRKMSQYVSKGGANNTNEERHASLIKALQISDDDDIKEEFNTFIIEDNKLIALIIQQNLVIDKYDTINNKINIMNKNTDSILYNKLTQELATLQGTHDKNASEISRLTKSNRNIFFPKLLEQRLKKLHEKLTSYGIIHNNEGIENLLSNLNINIQIRDLPIESIDILSNLINKYDIAETYYDNWEKASMPKAK